MPKRRRSSSKGGYHYGKRSDGTRYRIYHTKGRGKYSRKTGGFRRSSKRMSPSSVMGSRVSGFGKYSGIKGLTLGTAPPAIQNSKAGTIIRHREYITDISSTKTFRALKYKINPGNSDTFPWLKNIANNYEQWIPRGIIFHFKSTSSNAVVPTAGSNAALGTVIMATEYNVGNPDFASKQQMENYEWCTSADPSRSQLHPVECSKKQNTLGQFYVARGNGGQPDDDRFYDLGNFYIATQGMQADGVNIGELWVTYEMELRKPRLPVGVPNESAPAVDHFSLQGADLSSVDPTTPFGTNTAALIKPNFGSSLGGRLSGGIVVVADQTMDFKIPGVPGSFGVIADSDGTQVDSLANTYYFPDAVAGGEYMVNYVALYDTAGAVSDPTIVFTNCEAWNLLSSNTIPEEENDAATTSNTIMYVFFVRVVKDVAYFTIAAPAGCTDPNYVDVFVSHLPSGLE